jgi:hypothetical protein
MRTARGVEDVASRGSSVRLQLPLWGWATERATSGLLPANVPVAANVALLWQSVALQPGAPQTARVAFDIVANDTATDVTFGHRVAQGVLDTIVEHAIVGGTTPGGNAAALHALDIASGHDWIRLNAPADVARLNISPDAKARITAELTLGSIVIAPSSPVQSAAEHTLAWWQIDPTTGATIGVGENGLGTAESEYALLIEKVEAQGWCMALMLGSVLAGHVNGKSMGLFMFCIAAASAVPLAPTVVAKGFGVLELVLRAYETWSAQGTGPPGPHGHH